MKTGHRPVLLLLAGLPLVLGGCSASPSPTASTLSSKQLLSLLDAKVWEVPTSALRDKGSWRVLVRRFEAGQLMGEQPYDLAWGAGEFTAAGFLLREAHENGHTRVHATGYRFGTRESSTTLDSLGIEVDTSLVNSTDTVFWDASAPASQTMATYGLYQRHDNADGTSRFESIDWNDQTRNSAEFQALPSVVIVTLVKN